MSPKRLNLRPLGLLAAAGARTRPTICALGRPRKLASEGRIETAASR
jgi:hypothetical protein